MVTTRRTEVELRLGKLTGKDDVNVEMIKGEGDMVIDCVIRALIVVWYL